MNTETQLFLAGILIGAGTVGFAGGCVMTYIGYTYNIFLQPRYKTYTTDISA